MNLESGKKAYFASDFHLGAPNYKSSRNREAKIINWLNHISPDCQYLFLLGDVFDFWFDYHDVVPKGYTRLLGTLSMMADRGVQIFMFTGNHDMWMFGYLEEEIGLKVLRDTISVRWGNFHMMIGHGDGLGPGDHLYKILKAVFRNPLCQRLFAFLHPRIGMGIAKAWSRKSRVSNHKDDLFLGEREFLWIWCKEQEEKMHHDAYLFGHRHYPLDLPVGNRSRYVNLGEWLNHCLYAEFDGHVLAVKGWE